MGDETVLGAAKAAVASATHLERDGRDRGAIAGMFAAARKLDDWDRVLDAYFDALEMAEDQEERAKLAMKAPRQDNATLTQYLNYCSALGLTPVSRGAFLKPESSKAEVKDDLADFKSKKIKRA